MSKWRSCSSVSALALFEIIRLGGLWLNSVLWIVATRSFCWNCSIVLRFFFQWFWRKRNFRSVFLRFWSLTLFVAIKNCFEFLDWFTLVVFYWFYLDDLWLRFFCFHYNCACIVLGASKHLFTCHSHVFTIIPNFLLSHKSILLLILLSNPPLKISHYSLFIIIHN